MFKSTIENPELKTYDGYKVCCSAHGCPLCYRVSSQSEAEKTFTCDFHKMTSPDKWYSITRRLRANKWLYDLETLCRVRRASNASRFTDEEKDYINKLASSHNCDLLQITDEYNPRCFEFEQRLYTVQVAVIVEGKDVIDLNLIRLPKTEEAEEEEDFPL